MGHQLRLHVALRFRVGPGRLDSVDYNMAFGPQWFPFLGIPSPATSALFTTGQATIPAAAAGMPPLTFPMATLIFFQFVFAAITVIILAGSVLGRMNFTAWMIFCPVWMTLVYTVGAFTFGVAAGSPAWAWRTSRVAMSSTLPPVHLDLSQQL